jgi:hypothetical protein
MKLYSLIKMRKPYCTGHCNFRSYYHDQAGSGQGIINVYRGAPYQRGHGFGSFFKRFGIPLLSYLGKRVFKVGRDVAQDVFAGNQQPKEAIKRRLKEHGKDLGLDVLEKAKEKLSQLGTGRKRRKTTSSKRVVFKKARKSIRIKKDIFT